MAATPITALRFDPAAPHDVEVDDVVYARRDGEDLLARVYRPTGHGAPETNRPVLVDVHGGAWRYFDRQADTYFDRVLAACGAVVVALDFRQAPTHRWPSAAVDVNAGICWTKAHAAELGVDASDLGLIGGSSGGHLALVAALRPAHAPLCVGDFSTAPVWSGATTAPVVDARADARASYAVALWPIAAPDWRYRYLLDVLADPDFHTDEPMFDPVRLTRAHERFFGEGDEGQAAMRDASVLRMLADGDVDQLPPIWVVQPDLDGNVTMEMTTALIDAYRAAGGEAKLEVATGVGHSFMNFGGDAADDFITRMVAWIATQLHD